MEGPSSIVAVHVSLTLFIHLAHCHGLLVFWLLSSWGCYLYHCVCISFWMFSLWVQHIHISVFLCGRCLLLLVPPHMLINVESLTCPFAEYLLQLLLLCAADTLNIAKISCIQQYQTPAGFLVSFFWLVLCGILICWLHLQCGILLWLLSFLCGRVCWPLQMLS